MIMTKLKEATKHQHDSLENAVDILQNCSHQSGYVNLLRGFYSYHAAIEKSLARVDWQTLNFDFESRRKRFLLEKDLQSFGVNVAEVEMWADLPAIRAASEAVGCLYVLEGSTLGGRIISRHLREKLELNAENGAAYFNSYGERVGEMWMAFCLFANEFAAANNQENEIIGAAQQTFQSFEKCLQHQLN